jgi:AmmeMemoRadiSam system protein A
MEPAPEIASEPSLPPAEQRWLLELARASIACSVEGTKLDLREWSAQLPSERLRQPAGVFVTLRTRGELRGCIGAVRARAPLYLAVADLALAAALHDPRFAPVIAAELPELKIEISLLSPLFTIQPHQLIPGLHGLVVSRDFQQGVLLPCVAAERSWSREKFLAETCFKAGLPRDAWKQGVHLEAFTAQVFSES